MKLSRYNIEKKEDKSCLIYNTVTSAILELDTDYEKSYYEMKEGKKCSKPDLESALLEGGMLVEDDKDEFAELLIRNKIERFADSNLTLTIAPTMACNFCCPYCYEKGREYITMSETVQDQLTSQLKEKYQHIHELTVSWYGGEPLLAIETIEKLTKKIKSVLPLGCKYNADMVTNGYKLTRRVAEKLKDMDIHYIQVTLDGSKQAHDSRRILHNHQPTFEHILDNIRECADILNISIRINVDKTNINEATEIFDWLERYGLKGRVGYYLAPVDDINGVCNNHICMERPQYAKEEIYSQRIIILTVSVRGRLTTGMVIRIARIPPSMALRILNIPPIKVPFSIKLRGMKTGCCSSVLFMAAPPLVLPWKEFPELL